jgi:hypothetical protein
VADKDVVFKRGQAVFLLRRDSSRVNAHPKAEGCSLAS